MCGIFFFVLLGNGFVTKVVFVLASNLCGLEIYLKMARKIMEQWYSTVGSDYTEIENKIFKLF